MADIVKLSADGLQEKFIDNGDGSFSKQVSTIGSIEQAVPDYESPADILAAYGNFSEVNWANGDFVARVNTSNGQAITALSVDPITPGESRIVIDAPLRQPCVLEVEGSIVRNRQQFVSMGLYADDPVNGPDVVPSPINIVSISQSSAVAGAAYTGSAGTSCTVVLETALPECPAPGAVFLSDWINITGLVDSRLNYQNACINFISADRKTICFGFSDEVALPSLAIAVVTPTLGTAKVNFYNNAAGAHNGAGYRFTGTTDTSATIWSIFSGGDVQISGAQLGDHRVSMANSAVYTPISIMGQYEIKATSRFRIECRPDETTFLDKATDSVGGSTWNSRATRSSVKPGSEASLRPRFRIYQPAGMSRPVGKITTISKSGSSTATINLRTAPATPLAVGNVVSVYGVRDQTGFPVTTGAITAVITPTQFQMVVGSSATVSSYGGSVHIINGGASQPGVVSVYGSTAANGVGGNSDWLNLVCNTTVAGLTIGMYINMYGWTDASGNDLGIDGVWEVASFATTNLYLKPVYDIRGVRQSPVTPTLTATNCGGTMLIRTTARVHDLIYKSIGETLVMIDGQGTTRPDKAIPTYGVGGTMTASQGTAASLSTTSGGGGWPVNPAIVGIADIASAAITATATSATIINDRGNGFQIAIPVTAVTGTTPTMDIRIEESHDGGTNYVTLYEFERITAIGYYISPVLKAAGRNIRYVRTVGGTSPSFTHAVTRVVWPFSTPDKIARAFDRTISLTTLNAATAPLYSGSAVNSQLVVNLGAASTPPVLKLQGSDDKVNWYDLPSGSLTGVANSTVQVTVLNVNPLYIRAVVATAGVTVTPGYVMLKAFG